MRAGSGHPRDPPRPQLPVAAAVGRGGRERGRAGRGLDIAAGTGNAAIPAAARGAAVTASDLTPELLVAGQAAADAAGVPVAWEVADAESLPYADNEFDVVMSCIGVMFAPHHELAAAELLRVCRPGGRIGLLAWTPAGFIGQLFAALRPYAAPPPPGASPPRSGETRSMSRVSWMRAARRRACETCGPHGIA